MACGVHLGILLICLIKAEHVLCLWAQQARGQNGNTNVGFLQQGSGFGGSYPQNQLRRASGSRGSSHSSSFNTDTEVSSGYSQRFPSSGYTQGVSKPAKRSYASIRLVQSSDSESKPNWQTIKLSQGNVQKMPRSFGLSTNIASGSTISKYHQSPLSRKRTWPLQQGPPSTSNYQVSSSESLQSPRESYSFKPASHQSAAQKASSLTSTGAAKPHRIPARTKTSASAPARRVSSRRSSVASKPSYSPSLQNQITRNNPSSMSSLQTSWNSRNSVQAASNRPDSRTRSVGTSDQRFPQIRIHSIPQRFGGSAIIRLKEPADQKEVSVGKQQQAYVAPQRPAAQQQASVAPQRPSASYKPQVQSVHPEARWIRIPSFKGK